MTSETFGESLLMHLFYLLMYSMYFVGLPKWNSHKMSTCRENTVKWYQAAQIFILSQFDPQNWQPSMNREKLKLSQCLALLDLALFFQRDILAKIPLLWSLVGPTRLFGVSSSWQRISCGEFMPIASLLPFNFKKVFHSFSFLNYRKSGVFEIIEHLNENSAWQ